MPLYEYECTGCGEIFEELIRNPAEEAEVRCSACGAREVGRLMSASAATGRSCGAPAGSPFG